MQSSIKLKGKIFATGPGGFLEVSYPDTINAEEAVEALDENYFIRILGCNFSDANWNEAQHLRDAILSNRQSSVFPAGYVSMFNFCVDVQKRHDCFDYFLRFLRIDSPRILRHYALYSQYYYSPPLEITQAQRLASVIRSLKCGCNQDLSLHGKALFEAKGAFESVFNAVIDSGAVERLDIICNSITDLEYNKCISKSDLANNRTLKELSIGRYHDGLGDEMVYTDHDDAMKQLANALRRNEGLTAISLVKSMMTNIGREALLDGLRDNMTVVSLETLIKDVGFDDVDPIGDEERRLQSCINQHTKLNRFWKRLKEFPYHDDPNNNGDCNKSGKNNSNADEDNNIVGSNVSDPEEKQQQRRRKKKPIPMQIVPHVLEVLADKPLLLYIFLRDEIDYSQQNQPQQQRRSVRLSKKRRLQSWAIKY